ncbi:MFS general substrate transporter [Thozetella sp. PMI_491]|nr:MFS general substrate transporter [Thozetella sp. PMI_491]
MSENNQTPPKPTFEHEEAMQRTSKDVEQEQVDRTPSSLAPGSEYRKKVERRLVMKLDMKMSLLVVIYILNYIDRSNAAAARMPPDGAMLTSDRLSGFQSDLGIDDTGFATVISILFAGFILFQVPSNIIMNRIGRPSIYLPACMAVWGLISLLTGIVTTFAGAVACRFFIGLVEAAFSPGSFFLLSRWYTKKELSLRIAIFYCGNLISNAFGSLIAAGILANMEGVLGHRAWRWLFFIEGAITIAIAAVSPFILPDFPHNTTRHLTEEEVKVAQLRMLEDAGEVDEDSSEEKWYHGAKLAFTDWKLYILALAQITIIMGTSFSTYFPSLTKTLGYDNTKTLLLAAPPWIFCCFVALANTWHSDRVGERYWHFAWPLMVGIVGFIIAMATEPTNIGARYTSLFFMTTSYAGYIITFTWMSSSFPRPPAKRAVVISFVNGISQLGAIAGSYIWPSSYGPSFRISFGITTAMYTVGILCNYIFRQCLVAENKKLAAGEREAFENHADLSANANRLEQIGGHADPTKLREGFRYML